MHGDCHRAGARRRPRTAVHPIAYSHPMRAVVIDEVGVRPTVREVPEPACPPGGVVLDVSATGVCRSDWHAWQGHDPVPLPHVPGHELAGTIRQVGEGVTRWSVGDRVTTPFVCGCGACPTCAAGESQVCPQQTQPGFTGWGSWAEQVALHAADHNLVALPDALSDVHAAALGCRFATSYRALVTHGGVGPGQWVAVHGAGGNMVMQLMHCGRIGSKHNKEPGAETVAPSAIRAAGQIYTDTHGMVDFDEPRCIGWRHFGGHVWRYVLEAVDGGTMVTEQFDWTHSKSPRVLKAMGAFDKNRRSIEATLERLAAHFAK